MSWTEERINKAVDLYKAGFSCAKIAAELGEGVTRNAVIGKLHRLGVSRNGSPTVRLTSKTRVKTDRQPRKARPKAQRRPKQKVIKLVSQVSIIKRTSYNEAGPVDLMQLSDRKCRFPLEHDGRGHLFCGGKPMDGSSYCEQHHAITHEKKKKSEARRGGRFRFDPYRKAA